MVTITSNDMYKTQLQCDALRHIAKVLVLRLPENERNNIFEVLSKNVVTMAGGKSTPGTDDLIAEIEAILK